MKLNKKEIAESIEALAKIKAKKRALELLEDTHVRVLMKQGGGESANWLAKIVPVKEKVVRVKAHRQLRLYAKE